MIRISPEERASARAQSCIGSNDCARTSHGQALKALCRGRVLKSGTLLFGFLFDSTQKGSVKTPHTQWLNKAMPAETSRPLAYPRLQIPS